MAKRSGGFPGGGIPGGYANLLKQAQRMQTQMQENRQKLDEQEFSFASGGGAVKVVLTGAKKLTSIEIDKDAVDPDDVETLQDMIIAAVNGAMEQVDSASEQLFGGMAGGLGL